MMRKIIYLIVSLLATAMHAQSNIGSVLSEIEINNTSLKALRASAEAQKLNNKTGIYLPNPTVEFNYLWGSPSVIGNRNDVNASQQFDIPTITGMRGRLADQQNNLVELQYKAERIKLLLEAKQYCIDLIYYNRLSEELATRLEHAQLIAEAYQGRLNQGDVNKMEYNKVKLNMAMVQGEISKLELEQNTVQHALSRLNGGVELTLNNLLYSDDKLPTSFDQWYQQAEQKNPVLEYVRQELEMNKKRVSLNKAMRLPSFTAGYMREKVVGQQYQGLSFGISIPLWENKNRLKQAKAAVAAAESQQVDSKQQFHAQLLNSYDRASKLNAIAIEYRKTLSSLNNTVLLKKALEAGEISLIEYIVEIGLYYETINRTLEAERDFQKAYAELSAVEL